MVHVIKWFKTLQEAEDYFYENLEKYKHLLDEEQYEQIFCDKKNLLMNEGSLGVVCIETGEAYESSDIASFIKNDEGIKEIRSGEPLFWLSNHWIPVFAEMPIEYLENVSLRYKVNIKNLSRYVQGGFCIFDAINMSKKLEKRSKDKSMIYCKELNMTFLSVREAENYFRHRGLKAALEKGKSWIGFTFEKK